MKIKQNRHGAIVPLFAIVLPVMILLSAVAMNLSYMQLTESELKIATDAAARAGCRSWSTSQDMTTARNTAAQVAALNTVGGRALIFDSNGTDAQIIFGGSVRNEDGGRYQFTPIDDALVQGGAMVSGVQVNITQPTNLLMRVANVDNFNPSASSVASQIDRDIALVIDRSVSMRYYEDSTAFRTLVRGLKNAGTITPAESDDATKFKSVSENIIPHLSGKMLDYANSLNDPNTDIPVYSRWHSLETATEVFFDSLAGTDPVEQISISSFSQASRIDLELSENLQLAEDTVQAMVPMGSTAIGDGLLSGLTTLTSNAARQSAVRMIIVFTDGVRNGGIDPIVAVQQVRNENPNIIIHTVTFSEAADQAAMRTIAHSANGEHFHARTEQELVDIFRRIAVSVPTILTQ